MLKRRKFDKVVVQTTAAAAGAPAAAAAAGTPAAAAASGTYTYGLRIAEKVTTHLTKVQPDKKKFPERQREKARKRYPKEIKPTLSCWQPNDRPTKHFWSDYQNLQLAP